ncbi:MAG: glycosyltransferase [Syntrophobacteraceae bacterium]
MYIATMVRRIASTLNMNKPVIWSYLPNTIGIIKRLDFSKLVYHCIDDYGEFTGAPKLSFEAMEREILQTADLTVVSSRELLSLKRPHSKDIAYVPHGVDLKGFERELKNPVNLPDIDSVKGPTAGFVGRIADWIDLELVCRCASRLKHWSFVFVGPSNVDLSRYRSIGNMIFLGRKDHRLIPHYIKRFDVCLMPFVRNRLVASVNPLKLYEYLAVGKPVVSVPMPEIAEFAGVVTIAEPGDFCRHIQRVYETDSPSKQSARIDSVRGRSWEAVADTILERLACTPRR